MTSLFDCIADEIAHFDRPVDRALHAVLAPHEPEQHYTRGQGNRDRPSYLFCRTCRKTSPCTPLLLAAAELGLNTETPN
jgi:hypothetical protein